MRLTAICSVPTFGIGFALATGLGQGDTRLPVAQAPMLRLPAPKLRAAPPLSLVIPRAPSLNVPGNVMPHSYMVYGLQTDRLGRMACTDRNGAALPMPFNPQVYMGPLMAKPFSPQILPHTFTLPKLTLPKLAPQK